MANLLQFSVKLDSIEEKKEICSLGKTNWFLQGRQWLTPRWVGLNNKTMDFYFSRSRSNSRVKIYTTLIARGSVMSRESVILVIGQNAAVISIDVVGTLDFYELEGSITTIDNSEISNEDESNSTDSKLDFEKRFCTSTKLSEDLLCLLNNPDPFADATLKCGNAEIPVHRNILSARSPVFDAIFKIQVQEGCDGVVDVDDMEPEILQAMLKYMYSGKIDHVTGSLAEGLLFAADEYELDELKLICVEKLKSIMDANSVFNTLVIGDRLDDKSLLAHAVEFISNAKPFSELEKTEDWKLLQAEKPELAIDILTLIVKYLQRTSQVR